MPVNQILAVLTNRGANQLAQITDGFLTTTGMTYFRTGEGGFIVSGGVKFPKIPDRSQTVLDADDPALIPGLTTTLGHTPFVFQKSFVAADFTDPPESGTIFRVNPLLDFSDGNWANPPTNTIAAHYFEMGFFINTTATGRKIGSGDGVSTTFALTPPALPVNPASFTMTFTNPGPVTKTVTDNGSGGLVGDVGVGVNTINYQTGAINVTFSVAPGNTVPITVSYTSTPLYAYGTFPESIKTNLLQLQTILRVAY